MAQRVAEAESVVTAKANELFQNGDGNSEESEDLSDALYALQALRSVLKHALTPVDKPIYRMVGHLGYVVGIILGKSKRAFTAAPPKPQLVKGAGIKKKRLGRARNPTK